MPLGKFTYLSELKKKRNRDTAAVCIGEGSETNYKNMIRSNMILFGIVVACISIPPSMFQTQNAIPIALARGAVFVIVYNLLMDKSS